MTKRSKTKTPRQKKLRAAVIWLGAILAAIIGFVLLQSTSTKPAPYNPDESVDGITNELARDLPEGAPELRWADVTEQSGLHIFKNFMGDRTSQIPEDMGSGLAWGDFDRDGDADLFAVSAGGAMKLSPSEWPPCVLFENKGNGTFQPVKEFPEIRIQGMAAAWGDYNNDGWPDLAVSGYRYLAVFRNEGGTGRFVLDDQLVDFRNYWAGLAWGDFDRDRDLDLYVCGYVDYQPSDENKGKGSSQFQTFVPYTLNPSSYPPVANLLFENDGQGGFAERAAALGVNNPQGRSLGAIWHDFDDNGWVDLYVANDISDNVLYLNFEGTFQDQSHSAMVADYRGAMGLAVSDWNNDGDDDLFVTHWVAQENALYDNLLAQFRNQHTATNASPSNPDASRQKFPQRFLDISDQRGLGQAALRSVGWGTEFVDLDHDGWLDLLVANGSTLEIKNTQPRQLEPQRPFLFWNQHGQHFHDLAPSHPAWNTPRVGRGLAVADYDRDGDMDVAFMHLGGGLQLLRNDMSQGHWLQVRLASLLPDETHQGGAEAASVFARVGEHRLKRSINSVSYLSQSSPVLHFGLGGAERVESLEIHWPSGARDAHADLEADCLYEFKEGSKEINKITLNTGSASTAAPPRLSGKEREMEFWKRHRAGMDAFKRDKDYKAAAEWFQQAIALNPEHEDARYYYSHCLAGEGRWEAAMDQLKAIAEINPQSLRAFQQWGTLKALSADSRQEWVESESLLLRARRINPEEIGALLVLGEVQLVLGKLDEARQSFEAVCQSNNRSIEGYYLRAYLAWKEGQDDESRRLLESAKEAAGEEWIPEGATAEGDVRTQYHEHRTPLSDAWRQWTGTTDPESAFDHLEKRLDRAGAQ